MHRLYLLLVILCSVFLPAAAQFVNDPDKRPDSQLWQAVFSDSKEQPKLSFEAIIRLDNMAQNSFAGEIIYRKQGLPMAISGTIGYETSEGLKKGKPEPVNLQEMTIDNTVTGSITGKISLVNGETRIEGEWNNPQHTRKYYFTAKKISNVFTGFIKPEKAMKRFPGFTAGQMKQLLYAGAYCGIPLPTWLPPGFRVSNVSVNMGPSFVVGVDRRSVIIWYEGKKLPNGKQQMFAIEAGFDGLGDGVYTTTHTIASGVGKISLLYEPIDTDGTKMKNYIMTEWFSGTGTAFRYVDYCDDTAMGGKQMGFPISIETTKKILASLKRL